MIKIAKFGGSSVADAEHFKKIKAIVDADPARRFVVVSACGRRFKGDTKVTDLLYLVNAHVKYHVSCEELLEDIGQRYFDIADELELTYPIREEFAAFAERARSGGYSTEELVSRGEYFTARLMARTSAKDGGAERIMIVTATSGDTGKAALAGFADAPGTGITVFYPEGKVSRVQNLQMSTQEGDNVAVCGIRGNFDDAQSAVKRIFADKELAERLEAAGTVLSSANSINVGRLVPQVVYYFAAYAQLLRAGAIVAGDAVEFCVPTGNFGDILAGYYAKRMGLPVAKLIVASDKNNVLADFLTTGVYDRNRPFFTTISPSMDILISSNLERMLYFLSDGDCELVAGLMEQLAQTGRYEVPAELLAKIQSVFGCGWASEDEVRTAIKSCWDANSYVIDPHTACGYHVFEQVAPAEGAKARVLLSTASPYKFPRACCDALGLDVPEDDFEAMRVLEQATNTVAPTQLAELESKPVRFEDVCNVDEMANYVESAAKKMATN